MEDDLGESLIGGGATRRRPQRYSTLRLWLRRTVPHWSIRQWLLVSLVGGGLLYYYNTPRYSSSPLADWSPEFKNSYGKTTAAEWELRADAVKDAFVYAYDWYERVATLSFDEFLPLTAKGVNSLNGWGLTAIDSLDTMILMGLEPQINRTIHHIQQLDFRGTHRSKKTLFFETTIRYLGGLLSAYHLTGNQVLLDKANYLGNVLLPAFNTPSQIPLFAVDTATGEGILLEWSGGYSLLAEMASCQMEFKYLAKLTGNPLYFEKVDRITTILERQQGDRGLWNTFWNVTTGEQVNDHYTIGAWADSAYEYLLKEYLLTDQKDERLATMYKKAVYGAISELVFVSPKRHMLYITDIRQKMVTGKFEHLSCFFPALLMLGVWSLPNLTPQEQELHRMVAHGLAESCWLMYKDMHTGLGAESVLFEPFVLRDVNAGLFIRHYDKWVKKGRPGKGPIGLDPLAKPVSPKVNGPRYRDYHLKQAQYRLRPETVETMYIMWKTTGNPIWRERAWEIFKNLEKAVRVGYGYATLARVDIPFSGHKDEMASFLFAETFKYLYLSFIDPAKDPWPLDQYVFNTEAHPFPQFKWTNAEQERYDAFRASLRP